MAEKKTPNVLQGSIFLKLIVLAGIALIVSVFIFGVPTEIGDLIWEGLKIFLGIVLLAFVFKGIQAAFKPKPFSPTETFRKKIIRVAKLSKPFNVRELFIRGEDMRVYSRWGKIVGLLFIPYLCSKNKLDDKGKLIMIPKMSKNGKKVKDHNGNVVMVPQKEILTEKDGEWVFVTQTSSIPILSKTEIVRAHYSLCSDIGERVWIKSPNLVPIGDYFYPTQQWQEDILRIKTQHLSETLIETYEEFLDLLAHVTQMSLGSDPNFQKIMLAQSEAISARSGGPMVREG